MARESTRRREVQGWEDGLAGGIRGDSGDVTVDADADALAEWMVEVEERCPVADNLGAGTDVHVEVERA